MPPFSRFLILSIMVAGFALSPLRGASQPTERCPQGRIREIRIENGPILHPDSIANRRFSWGWRWVDRLHIRTRSSFIRSDLLFGEGDCYDPLLLADSERILRSYPFIASSSALGDRSEDGDWTVVVATRDEWSTRLNLSASLDGRFLFQGLSLAEANFLGRGITGSLFYFSIDQSRNRGVFLAFPRLFGSRVDGRVAGARTRTGNLISFETSYPFLGESGRVAGLQLLSHREDYIAFGTGSREGISHVLLPVRDREAEVTLARRWGRVGNLVELGLSLAYMDLDAVSSREDVRTAHDDRFDDLGTVPDSLYGVIAPQAIRTRSTVGGIMVGHRRIRLVSRTGLELIDGTQDIATGTDLSTYLGVGISGMGTHVSGSGDILLGGRFFSAASGSRGVLNVRASLEGRRARYGHETESRFRDIRFESEALAYWTPFGHRGHFFGRLRFQGGWNIDQLYQATLGGARGLRGYFQEELPIGSGVLGSLEIRMDFRDTGPVDLGLTAFFDGGRGWAAGAPFGRDTGWLGSVGGGFRWAFPSGSRAMIRLEGAWPMGSKTRMGDLLVRAYLVDLQGLLGLRGNSRNARGRFNGYFNRLRGG